MKGSGKSKDAAAVLAKWLAAHPIPRPEAKLAAALDKTVKGMWWPSETDRVIYAVDLGKAPGPTASVVNAARKALGEPDSALIEERDFEATFDHLTEVYDPSDADEVATKKRFGDLRDVLKANLTELKFFRVGAIDIDVYAVGKDKNGHWVGVTSGVVET